MLRGSVLLAGSIRCLGRCDLILATGGRTLFAGNARLAAALETADAPVFCSEIMHAVN